MSRPTEPLAERAAFRAFSAPHTPPASAAALTLPASVTCANCLAPVATLFCGECGVPRIDTRPVTTRRFVGDIVNEVTSVDSLTIRSLRSLFTRPGELTKEYLAGRTRWYLSPVRLYLLIFGVFLFGEAVLPNTDAMYARMEARMAALETRKQRDLVAAVAAQHVPATARQRIMLTMSPSENAANTVRTARFMGESRWIQLINALTWGALLALLYRRRHRNHAEHMVFALHLLAFNLLLVLAASALRSTLDVVPGLTSPDWIVWLQWLAIGSYFFIASRRLYEESRVRTGIKSVVFVAGAQLSMIVLSTAAVFVVGVRHGAELARAAHLRQAPTAVHGSPIPPPSP
jgi:hypothetical protein